MAGREISAVALPLAWQRSLRRERRVAYTAGLFAELGWPADEARRRALLAVTAYLGHAQMAHVAPGTLPDTEADRDRYIEQMFRLLTAPDPRPTPA